MGRRNRRHNRRGGAKRQGKKTFSIIVDGETELWYFQMMKQHEKDRLPLVDVKPDLPKKKKLKEQFQLVQEHVNLGYDTVVWLLDLDTLLKEDREKSKTARSIFEELGSYIQAMEKHSHVHILVNAPCLEFWHLLHFKATGRYFPTCKEPHSRLKKDYLKDYKKTERYYKQKNNDIYLKLKPYQAQAVEHASNLGRFDINDPQKPKAEVYEVLRLLKLHG